MERKIKLKTKNFLMSPELYLPVNHSLWYKLYTVEVVSMNIFRAGISECSCRASSRLSSGGQEHEERAWEGLMILDITNGPGPVAQQVRDTQRHSQQEPLSPRLASI